ncbi:MAG: 16S rRNA (adenine(1518)-N(6)/adenine(1519)-N(6))-dimethyltransferase RsmA [Bacteroidetes bacterium]|nr:16S rRNA (adenine(1518)-N(6)/adenine(1519)-N(6))-dimethyltransferase RsmA [Bacteroidota bacterium]
MNYVRPKKHLGQHFLKDENIAQEITSSISESTVNLLEIGPGTGVLTKYLLKNEKLNLFVIEIDTESVTYLTHHFPQLENRILAEDFLHFPIENLFNHESYSIIGNFPYNISSQILFKVLEHREQIPEVVGMFQKEVAERIASKPGKKAYGILSVLLQAYYNIEYLFTVDEHQFIPPPKVKSAVIRVRRNAVNQIDCDDKLFFRVVKTAFNQRRKTLRNALNSIELDADKLPADILSKRAEQLSVEDFIRLTNAVKVNF